MVVPPALFRYELPTHEFSITANRPVHLIHGTQDEKIPSNSSDRMKDNCDARNIKVKGHSIMCSKHNLRDPNAVAEFEEKAASILK